MPTKTSTPDILALLKKQSLALNQPTVSPFPPPPVPTKTSTTPKVTQVTTTPVTPPAVKSATPTPKTPQPTPTPTQAPAPFREPTPVVPMVGISGESNKPRTDEEIRQALLEKSFKQKYGSSLSPDEISYLAKQEIEKQNNANAEAQRLREQQIQEYERQKVEAERLEAERKAQLEKDRAKNLMEYGAARQGQANVQIAAAQDQGKQRTSIAERLLGANGNLTGSPGEQRLNQINDEVNNTISSINAAVQADIALEKARLEGADETILQGLSQASANAREREGKARLASLELLETEKMAARQAGDQNLLNLLQGMSNSVSYDKNLTESINDEYVYGVNTDGSPMRLKDETGNFIKRNTEEENKLLEISAGASVFDPKSGKFVGTAPQQITPYQSAQLAIEKEKGISMKEPNVEQAKARQFAVAAQQANEKLNSSTYQIGNIENPYIPNALKSSERQSFEQAARAFINAVLRRESGATLTDDEFKNKYKEVIPAPGDKPEVLAQKKAARESAVQSITNAGGQGFSIPSSGEGGGDGLDNLLGDLGFKKPLSTGEKGSNVAKIAQAIGQFESGSNYNSRGPVVTSGAYKGERALGKYQIMPGNLPSWSKEALGRVVSEKEFLSNPKIQDAIAEHQMSKIFDKYGTVEDVASVWFSGRPIAKAGNAKDVIGTTVPQYVKNVRAIYNNLS